MGYIKLNDCRKAEPDALEIIEEYEPIDAMYGVNIFALTDKEIRALKDGKGLYFSDGEFATVIYRR